MVTVLSGRIQQVACIDRATACLLANGEVIVLTNFISSRLAYVIFCLYFANGWLKSLCRFPPSRLFPMPSHNPTNQPPRIIQLRAGQNEIGFLDSWGDIFICPVESDEKSVHCCGCIENCMNSDTFKGKVEFETKSCRIPWEDPQFQRFLIWYRREYCCGYFQWRSGHFW